MFMFNRQYSQIYHVILLVVDKRTPFINSNVKKVSFT